MKNKIITNIFFDNIKDAEFEMKSENIFDEKRKQIASDYFEINRNIENTIRKKYCFSDCYLFKNSFYINDCFYFKSEDNDLLTFYSKKKSIILEKTMNSSLYNLINEPNDVFIRLNDSYEDQIEVRLKIRDNLKNIKNYYHNEINESSIILLNIVKILNKIELSGMFFFNYIIKEKLYEIMELYQELEKIQDQLLLLKDINIKKELECIKFIINIKK